MTNSIRKSLFVLVLGSSLVGCSRDAQPKTYPVTGTAMLRGIPLPDAVVTFMPEYGRHASGITDAQGKFTLSTFAPADGALEGRHIVTIAETAREMPEGDYSIPAETNQRMPGRYAEPAESGLVADVKTNSNNDFTFQLTE